VLRAGTNTAVKLAAAIQNDGNIQLPPQGYTLNVIDTQTNTVTHIQTVAGRMLAVSELDTLPFDDWTPVAGGNFRIELISPNPGEGKITTSLYVGDAGSARYTINKLVVRGHADRARQHHDHGTGRNERHDQRSVGASHQDRRAESGHLQRCGRRLGNHREPLPALPRAIAGTGRRRAHAQAHDYDANNRNTIFNAIIEYQQSNGAIDGFTGGYQMTQSMLGLWALNAWHKKNEIVSTLVKGAQYLESVQDGAGAWNADHASGWWSTQVANTAFNVKNLIEIRDTLSRAPDGSAVNHVATPWYRVKASAARITWRATPPATSTFPLTTAGKSSKSGPTVRYSLT